MASREAVGKTMMMLARTFSGGHVDKETVELYAAAFSDLTDAQLETGCLIVIKTHTGGFIPPPAVIRKAIAPAPLAIDSETITRRISKLGTYHPNAGWIYPSVETVQEQLGEAIGYAYAAAGGRRLFAESETTREIATREFQTALVEAEKRPHAQLPVLGAGNGNGSPLPASIRDTIKRIGSGPAPDAEPVSPD